MSLNDLIMNEAELGSEEDEDYSGENGKPKKKQSGEQRQANDSSEEEEEDDEEEERKVRLLWTKTV